MMEHPQLQLVPPVTKPSLYRERLNLIVVAALNIIHEDESRDFRDARLQTTTIPTRPSRMQTPRSRVENAKQ